MDSLTQGLLGAATFGLVMDKEIGKKSLLIGAIAGTIPDLDVFLSPFFNDIEFLTIHRSVSHSIIFAVLMSFLLGKLFYRIYKKKSKETKWMFAFFLAIMTHSLLDWCTTYGTKLLSPFSSHLFSTNNIHVFEPFYTLILLVGVILMFVKSKKSKNILKWTLILSTVYIGWTFTSKTIATHHFVSELNRQNIGYDKILVSPTPLNSLLWHGIIKTKEGYFFATYSLLDKSNNIHFQFEKSENKIIKDIEHNRLVDYYLNYTQGFPLIKVDNENNVKIYAIKYGPINYYGKPEFVYPLSFNMNDLSDENIRIVYNEKQRGPIKNYKNLVKRIFGNK